MKHKIISALILFFLVSLAPSSPKARKYPLSNLFYAKKTGANPQIVKKPKYDYMSTFLSRSTKPLGLKENLALKKYLNQPSIKWAIRAGQRHILN